ATAASWRSTTVATSGPRAKGRRGAGAGAAATAGGDGATSELTVLAFAGSGTRLPRKGGAARRHRRQRGAAVRTIPPHAATAAPGAATAAVGEEPVRARAGGVRAPPRRPRRAAREPAGLRRLLRSGLGGLPRQRR